MFEAGKPGGALDGSAGGLPAAAWRFPALLVALVVLLQGAAWMGWLPVARGEPGRVPFALAEMLLLALLLWHGWRILRAVKATAAAGGEALPVARLVFASLALCLLGDLVNRNLAQVYFAYDAVIEHSYLADSTWFFFPGYLLFIIAAWRATRARVAAVVRLASLAVAALAGVATFAGLVLPGTSTYVQVMTGSYTVLISLMAPVALWIVLAFGRAGLAVACGALLATVADALIGHFWLFGSGWYPGVAYLNFVVYFLSQALLQQFPLVVARRAG